MRKILLAVIVLAVSTAAIAQKKAKINKNKQAVLTSVDAKYDELTALSDAIWGFEEIAFRETQSAEALIAYAEKQGFRVKKAVAGMPTAFVAEYGSGKPVIGVLGEFDALPGLSQKDRKSVV